MAAVTDSISGKRLRFRGSFIYEVSPDGDEAVESVGYGEGRFYAAGQGADSTDFADVWFVRDYLGSVRMAVDITEPDVQTLADAVLSRSDYLPFGMPFRPAAYTDRQEGAGHGQWEASEQDAIPQSAISRWQFNGKPEQVAGLADTGLLDYGARLYDHFTARWNSVDPMADKYPDTSPYAFCANDPVNFVDIQGDSLKIIDMILLNAIYHGLPKDTELNLKLNNGVVEHASISGNSSDWFIKDLVEIVNSGQMVELSVAHNYQHQDEYGNVSTENFDDIKEYNTMELQDKSSPKLKGAPKHRAVGIAHEFGHAILYLRGLPHKHGEPGVDYFVYNCRANLMSIRLGYVPY